MLIACVRDDDVDVGPCCLHGYGYVLSTALTCLLLFLRFSTAKATLTIGVYDSDVAKVASDVVGWIYFAAWTFSFYPQIYENWKRKW